MLLPSLVVCEIEHLRTRHAFDLVTVYDVVQEGLVTPEDLVTLGARISVFLFSSLGLGNFLWLQARFAVFSQVSRFHVFNLQQQGMKNEWNRFNQVAYCKMRR